MLIGGGNILYRFVLVLLVFLLSACVSTASKIEGFEKVSVKKTYIAGYFNLVYRESLANMGVKLVKVDSRRVNGLVLQFDVDEKPVLLDVYELEPGRYRITSLVRIGGAGMDSINMDAIPELYGQPFNMEAGKIYFVGKFTGKGSKNYWKFNIRTASPWFSCHLMTENPDKRTVKADLLKSHPLMSGLPLVFPFY